MMSSLVNLAQHTEDMSPATAELPMPAWMFGIVAFGIFMLMLLITLAYRNVHTRRR